MRNGDATAHTNLYMHPLERVVRGVYMGKAIGAMPAPLPILSVALPVQHTQRQGKLAKGGHPRTNYKSSPQVIHG